MSYHLPLEKRWDAGAVCAALINTGLDAHVEENIVVIEVARVFNSRFRFVRAFQRLRGHSQRITICWRPDRLISRLSIESDPWELWFERDEQINAAIKSQGFLLVGEDISEREIAMRYCRPSMRLLRKLCALEELDAASWRSDVDLPSDWIVQRFEILEEIEDLIVESEDFCESGIEAFEEAMGATDPSQASR